MNCSCNAQVRSAGAAEESMLRPTRFAAFPSSSCRCGGGAGAGAGVGRRWSSVVVFLVVVVVVVVLLVTKTVKIIMPMHME